jgi:hypothetical protein
MRWYENWPISLNVSRMVKKVDQLPTETGIRIKEVGQLLFEARLMMSEVR